MKTLLTWIYKPILKMLLPILIILKPVLLILQYFLRFKISLFPVLILHILQMELSISVHKLPYPQPRERTSSMFKLPDLSSPPPAIPPGYGTSLYPGENLDPNSSPEKILEEISRKRKSTELATFVKSKVKNYRDIRKKNFHLGKKYCSICSEYSSSVFPQSQVIFHNHNSSKSLRMSSAPRRWGVYPCSFCKTQLHSFKTGIRQPVLVTSSLLNDWQGDRRVNEYPGDDIHVDMIGIPGGTVRILHHAFMAEFGSSSTPVDVLVVGTVNDVMRGKNATKIIRDLKNSRMMFSL